MMISYDEALTALQELEAGDKLRPFEVGDIVHGLVAQDTEHVTKRVASDLGRSLAWVRQRDRVAKAFPPEVRAELWVGAEPPPPVTWRHHWIAAFTNDPPAWIRLAIDDELSTRQLQDAIDGEKPDRPDDVVITVDMPAAEIHVQFRPGTTVRVTDTPMGGVLHCLDASGTLLATRLRLPAEVVGRKVRLRRAR